MWRAFFGETLLSLRVLPSLGGAATVLLASALAGVLGGGSFARTLTAAAVLAAPTVLGITSFYSMNAFDFVFWIASMLLLARLCVAEAATRRRLWLMLGMMVGLGLLNKLSVGALGAGVGAAVLLTPLRSDLRTWSPWLGGVIALACVTPYALWHFRTTGQPSSSCRTPRAIRTWSWVQMGFLLAQVQDFGPLNAVVWGTGLVWLVLGAGGRFRALAMRRAVGGMRDFALLDQAKEPGRRPDVDPGPHREAVVPPPRHGAADGGLDVRFERKPARELARVGERLPHLVDGGVEREGDFRGAVRFIHGRLPSQVRQ